MQTLSKKNSIIIAIVAIAGVFTAVIGVKATGTSQTSTATINATVMETMTLSCGNATIPNLTANTPQSVQAACTATTNGAAGFNLKVHKTTAASDATKTLVNGTTWIVDTSAGLAAYDGTGSTPALWTSGTTKGLGFRVQVSGTTNANALAYWAADGAGTAKYAAFPVADQTVYNYASYASAASAVTIDYKLDVPTTQMAGSYSGTVLYTATTN